VSVARDPRRSGFVGGGGRVQFKLGNNGGDALGRPQYLYKYTHPPPTHAINRAGSTRAARKSQTDRQSLNELSARVYRSALVCSSSPEEISPSAGGVHPVNTILYINIALISYLRVCGLDTNNNIKSIRFPLYMPVVSLKYLYL